MQLIDCVNMEVKATFSGDCHMESELPLYRKGVQGLINWIQHIQDVLLWHFYDLFSSLRYFLGLFPSYSGGNAVNNHIKKKELIVFYVV